MLREIESVKQIEGEPRRRWFSDEYFDLIVWLNESDDVVAFQLCYDKPRNERALTWMRELGYMHHRVDDGEHRLDIIQKATPILIGDGHFDHKAVAGLFNKESNGIERSIAGLVHKRIRNYKAESGKA